MVTFHPPTPNKKSTDGQKKIYSIKMNQRPKKPCTCNFMVKTSKATTVTEPYNPSCPFIIC
jgi:hypothetical protein